MLPQKLMKRIEEMWSAFLRKGTELKSTCLKSVGLPCGVPTKGSAFGALFQGAFGS